MPRTLMIHGHFRVKAFMGEILHQHAGQLSIVVDEQHRRRRELVEIHHEASMA